MNLWQVGAAVITGPGLGSEPASIDEVREAVLAQGLDDSEVEQVDEGVFMIPLTPAQEDEVEQDGGTEFEINGVQFTVEMP